MDSRDISVIRSRPALLRVLYAFCCLVPCGLNPLSHADIPGGRQCPVQGQPIPQAGTALRRTQKLPQYLFDSTAVSLTLSGSALASHTPFQFRRDSISPGGSMATLLHDLRFAARMLWKSPGFTAIAILTLALGIGANTAIFSMVDSFLLRPLPVKDPGELVVLACEQNQGPLQEQLSYAALLDIREQTASVFSEVTGSFIGLDGLSVNGHADRIVTVYVTGDYFGALGLKPAVGRLILPSEGKEIGADPVLVLAHSYWKSRFNADPNIVGQKVTLDGHLFTIVGVAPEGFHGTQSIIDPGGYLPYGMSYIEGGANATDYMVNRNVR